MNKPRSAEELARLARNLKPGDILTLFPNESLDDALALITREDRAAADNVEEIGSFWQSQVIANDDPLKTARQLMDLRDRATYNKMSDQCVREIDMAFTIVMQAIRSANITDAR